MSLRIYNTLTRRKDLFEPAEPGKVGIYLCGPTVYKPSHIGHAVGPVIFDAVKRYLINKGFDVTLVVNITDVDDKLIAEADAQGRPMEEIAREVEANYKACMERLNVEIDEYPRATENIAQIVELVGRLIEQGAAYAVDGDVYFDHAAAVDYGKLSGRRLEEQLSGTRELAGKARHPADFAVWKAAEEGQPGWESPWGRGRPGWHIECSAMAMARLGETLDIHGGGMDLIFPHHENEIAQSETATGKPFARYWMHNGLTRIRTKATAGEWKNEKMSKSLGNIRQIDELLDEYGGELLRAFVLGTHYRRPLEFSDEQLTATARSLETFYRLFERVERVTGSDAYGDGMDIVRMHGEAPTDADRAFVDEVVRLRLSF
jgi:cysteinyl-tRNA synthetase